MYDQERSSTEQSKVLGLPRNLCDGTGADTVSMVAADSAPLRGIQEAAHQAPVPVTLFEQHTVQHHLAKDPDHRRGKIFTDLGQQRRG